MTKLTPTEPVLTSKPDGDTKIPDPKTAISKSQFYKAQFQNQLDEITSSL
jgi:hypothetical protein